MDKEYRYIYNNKYKLFCLGCCNFIYFKQLNFVGELWDMFW